MLVGVSTTAFLKLLHLSTNFTSQFPYFYLSLPLTFLLCTFLINFLAPQSKGHGTEKVIEAIHKRSGRIPAGVIPIKLFTTIITIASGGSVGKEGPSGQIGAGLASLFSDIFRLNDQDRRKLVICGISAGFAAVFGTPISGAIFGLEVLYVGAVMRCNAALLHIGYCGLSYLFVAGYYVFPQRHNFHSGIYQFVFRNCNVERNCFRLGLFSFH